MQPAWMGGIGSRPEGMVATTWTRGSHGSAGHGLSVRVEPGCYRRGGWHAGRSVATRLVGEEISARDRAVGFGLARRGVGGEKGDEEDNILRLGLGLGKD